MTGQITIKVKKPKPLDEKAMQKAYLDGVKKTGNRMADDFTKITRSWKGGGVPFIAKAKEQKTQITMEIRPLQPRSKEAQIWRYLDEGTKAHEIRPRKAKALRFQTGYKAGSRPNSLNVGTSKKSGPEVFRKRVRHPGFAARNWSILMAKKWKPKIQQDAIQIMTLVTRASGHQYK